MNITKGIQKLVEDKKAKDIAEDIKNEDEQIAAAGQFVGFDKSGNAIYNKNGQYSSFGKDYARTHAALNADTANKNKSWEDYAGQQQAAGMGEFQGFDKESGSAVFKNAQGVVGANKADFGDMYGYLNKQADANKQWINPEYEKQYNEATAGGTKYEGTDTEGNQIIKDALGHYQKIGDTNSGFSKFAKYNLADQKFAGAQGEANATQGENKAITTPVAGTQREQASNAQSNLAKRMPFQNRGGSYSKFAEANTPTAQTSQEIQKPNAVITPTTETSIPKQAALESTASKQLAATPAPTKTASPAAPTPLTNVFNQPSIFDNAKTAATNYAKNAANTQVNTATNTAASVAGINNLAITNPAAYARQQALQQAGASTGVNDIGSLVSNPAEYAKQKAIQALSSQYGFDSQALTDPNAYAKNLAMQQVTSQLGFNPLDVVSNPGQAAQDYAKKQALAQLSSQLGFPITEQALTDPVGFAKSAGLNAAKTMALNTAASQLGESAITNAAGDVVPYGSMIKGGLDVGSTLLHGGLNEDSANAAGQAAARAALASMTGGLVSPESMQLNSMLQDKAYQESKKLLGNTLGGAAGGALKAGSAATQVGADTLNAGIERAGSLAGGQYNLAKQGLGGLKQITKGDVLGGLTSMGKAGMNMLSNTMIKQPAAIAKKVLSSVTDAVANFFCFDGETEILMADDTYKKN